jgi:hypothetical protein
MNQDVTDHYYKPVETYNSIQEIEETMIYLRARIYECVGTLYPSIMEDRIAKLYRRKVELTQYKERT